MDFFATKSSCICIQARARGVLDALQRAHVVHLESAEHGVFMKAHFPKRGRRTNASTDSTASTSSSLSPPSPTISQAISRQELLHMRSAASLQIPVANTFIHFKQDNNDVETPRAHSAPASTLSVPARSSPTLTSLSASMSQSDSSVLPRLFDLDTPRGRMHTDTQTVVEQHEAGSQSCIASCIDNGSQSDMNDDVTDDSMHDHVVERWVEVVRRRRKPPHGLHAMLAQLTDMNESMLKKSEFQTVHGSENSVSDFDPASCSK